MSIDPPATADALAAAFCSGSITPTALIDNTLGAIAAQNPALNAFLCVDQAGARAAAAGASERFALQAPLGRLDGVPVAIKDNFHVAGLPTTGGHSASGCAAQQEDADAVALLRQAGAIIVGKTNMDEGALGAATNNPHHGATLNPLAAGHSAGGSSGGSAAAVAAGLAPLALGSDTLGSVRIPAAYCGLFGLKPTAGTISRSGLLPLAPSLDTVGILARTAADVRMALSVIGPPDASPAPDAPLRVGVLAMPDVEIEPAVHAGLDAALRALGALQAEVGPLTIDLWEPSRHRHKAFLIIEAEAADAVAPQIAHMPERYGDDFVRLVRYGERLSEEKRTDAYAAVRSLTGATKRAFDSVDLLLLPTTPQRAFKHTDGAPANQADLTALASVAGLPALAVPVWIGDDALPASVQLIGPAGSEALLLDWGERLSAQLSRQ